MPQPSSGRVAILFVLAFTLVNAGAHAVTLFEFESGAATLLPIRADGPRDGADDDRSDSADFGGMLRAGDSRGILSGGGSRILDMRRGGLFGQGQSDRQTAGFNRVNLSGARRNPTGSRQSAGAGSAIFGDGFKAAFPREARRNPSGGVIGTDSANMARAAGTNLSLAGGASIARSGAGTFSLIEDGRLGAAGLADRVFGTGAGDRDLFKLYGGGDRDREASDSAFRIAGFFGRIYGGRHSPSGQAASGRFGDKPSDTRDGMRRRAGHSSYAWTLGARLGYDMLPGNRFTLSPSLGAGHGRTANRGHEKGLNGLGVLRADLLREKSLIMPLKLNAFSEPPPLPRFN